MSRDGGRSVLDRLGLPRWATIGAVSSLVAAVVLAGLAWSAVRTANAREDFERTGRYSYTLAADYLALAPPSSVYPSGFVGTTLDDNGQRVAAGPLYGRLVESLRVEIAADVKRSGSARDAEARLDTTVRIRNREGWSTVVSVLPGQPVAGETVVPVDIALAPLRAQVADIGAQTGVGGSSFTIEVATALTVDPGPVDTDSPGGGRVDIGRLSVEFQVGGDVITATPIGPVSGEGLVGNRVTRAGTMSVFGNAMRVDLARVVFPGLALVALGALVAFASVLFGGFGLSGSKRITARYRTRIVDVAMTTAPGPVVLVISVAELARIARAEHTVILHEELDDGSHRYRVVLGTVTYEYQTVPEHAGRASDLLEGGERGAD